MVRERGERPVEAEAISLPPDEIGAMSSEESDGLKFEPPINWWTLNHDDRVEVLMTLVQWVPELVRRFGLPEKVVPPCWYQHESLIQELLAFYQYRDQQQYHPEAPSGVGQDVMYQFQLTITRLRHWVEELGCTVRDHYPTRISHWADTGVSGGAEDWEDKAIEFMHSLPQAFLKDEPDEED